MHNFMHIRMFQRVQGAKEEREKAARELDALYKADDHAFALEIRQTIERVEKEIDGVFKAPVNPNRSLAHYEHILLQAGRERAF